MCVDDWVIPELCPVICQSLPKEPVAEIGRDAPESHTTPSFLSSLLALVTTWLTVVLEGLGRTAMTEGRRKGTSRTKRWSHLGNSFPPKSFMLTVQACNYTSSSQHVFPRTSRISMGKKKKDSEVKRWIAQLALGVLQRTRAEDSSQLHVSCAIKY